MSRPRSDDNSVLLVHAYLDGELDPANALSVAQQMSQEPALAAEAERVKELQKLIHDRLPREAAPPGLRARIESSVGGTRRERAKPSWLALAASIVLAAMVAGTSTWLVVDSRQQPMQVAELLVSDHIRSLMAPEPVDVVSSDRHTVKPWFNGRISNSPRVVDLARNDFPLIGGRVDVLGRTPVSTLVYRRAKHLISLTAVPADGAPALNGGPHFKFNEAISFHVACESQAEVDYFWDGLGAGGQIQQCGWLKDKFGVSWQIVPTALPRLLAALLIELRARPRDELRGLRVERPLLLRHVLELLEHLLEPGRGARVLCPLPVAHERRRRLIQRLGCLAHRARRLVGLPSAREIARGLIDLLLRVAHGALSPRREQRGLLPRLGQSLACLLDSLLKCALFRLQRLLVDILPCFLLDLLLLS